MWLTAIWQNILRVARPGFARLTAIKAAWTISSSFDSFDFGQTMPGIVFLFRTYLESLETPNENCTPLKWTKVYRDFVSSDRDVQLRKFYFRSGNLLRCSQCEIVGEPRTTCDNMPWWLCSTPARTGGILRLWTQNLNTFGTTSPMRSAMCYHFDVRILRLKRLRPYRIVILFLWRRWFGEFRHHQTICENVLERLTAHNIHFGNG